MMGAVNRRLLFLFSLTVPVILLIPPVRSFMEASMLRHMLGALPLLIVAGGTCSYALSANVREHLRPWNQFGIPGLLFTALILTAWMIPLALDRATENLGVDAIKAFSVFLAGFSLCMSFSRAQLVIQLFFVWNWVAMTVFIGVLYQSLPQRLCSAYLIDDQERTGLALVMLAVAMGAVWGIHAWRRFQAQA